LRGGLQFAEGLGKPALLAQRQSQTAVRGLHFRLRFNGLPKSLFRPRGVVLVQKIERLQDEVRRWF
jgi:hypothetical protein